MRAAVIVDAVRTPSGKGKPGGALSGVHPVDLLAGTLEALLARTGLDPALVEDVIVGCAQQVGEQSGNIARNAVLAQPPRADRRPVRAADHVRSRRHGQRDDHRAPLTRPPGVVPPGVVPPGVGGAQGTQERTLWHTDTVPAGRDLGVGGAQGT
jgi:hypothetical protein